MTDLEKTNDDTPTEKASLETGAELAQTMVHAAPIPQVTKDSDSARGTKQSRDLAFAVAILKTGSANMRSLAIATKSWTTFGNSSLAEHLLSSNVISGSQQATAQRRAQQALSSLSMDGANKGSGNGAVDLMSQSVRQRHWLTRLDPDGKVAKLLGIADTSMLSNDEIEDRQVDSRYTLLRKLGQGGLGIVWLARDQNLQRYVAVKEISRDVASDDPALDHFRREAEITGRLEHPGIVPIYQYGEDEATGKSFYVMRFLGKKTLQDAIAEYHERRASGNADPMLLHRLLSALISVCHSIGHAHSRKVIHRDLKPENVALDEFGQVTLLDWGLAKINDATGMYDLNGRIEPGDIHSVGSTQVGRVLGTPLYMAPEQASARVDEVDELTDVYALGGILYAILTGLAPHQSAIEEAGSTCTRSDIMSKIVEGSIADPQKVIRSVPPELSAVCMKALSSKRYLRYESAADFAEDVQHFIAGTPVNAYTPPVEQRIKRWMASHPTLTQSILLIASLLLIGGAAITYTIRKAALAVHDARYAAVQDFAEELEVNLNFETEGLVRNLHFVSELPLMNAIVMSQQQAIAQSSDIPTDLPSNELPASPDASAIHSLNEVSADEWLNRQGNVFDGLLRANPAYLIAFASAIHADGSMTDLVRSERITAGQRVNRVPRKQLVAHPSKDAATEETKMREALRPDEVVLITNDQLSDDIPVKTRSPLVLSGVRAIFDADGDLFGLNIIELDLRHRLEELCHAVAPDGASVSITDVLGNVAMEYHQGRFAAVDEMSIGEEFPELRSFFAADSKIDSYGDGNTFFAKRVRLGGSTGKAEIGIVVHLHPDHSH